MNRRDFLASTSALAAFSRIPSWAQRQGTRSSFPDKVLQGDSPYVEHEPIEGYHNAPAPAVESFFDKYFGARNHRGLYYNWHPGAE
jgi:hypothetical protein